MNTKNKFSELPHKACEKPIPTMEDAARIMGLKIRKDAPDDATIAVQSGGNVSGQNPIWSRF